MVLKQRPNLWGALKSHYEYLKTLNNAELLEVMQEMKDHHD